jgi:DNA-binding PadR family transcriptional regulator
MATGTNPDDHLPLTATTFHLLLALEDGDAHGYRLMQDVEAQSGGRVVIGPGTIYEAVQRLKASGFIAESETLPGPKEDQRRRYYTLTDLGRCVLRAEAARLVDVADLVKARKLAKPRGA